MTELVTIVSIRAHGVTSLLIYRLGKREGDWPCCGNFPPRHRANSAVSSPPALRQNQIYGAGYPSLEPTPFGRVCPAPIARAELT